MNWPMIIGVSWIAIGGALTLAGVRITASQLSFRVGAKAQGGSSRLLVQGIVMLAVGLVMLLSADAVIEAVLAGRAS